MKLKFNEDWDFRKQEDTDWSIVQLPHDAMLHEKRDPDLADGRHTGFFPGGKYIYQKTFEFDKDWFDKDILVEFEGVYQKASIYINDQLVHFQPYGYTRFFVDLTKFVVDNNMNILRVEVDNTPTPNSRWYSGSGIYRDVFLHINHKDALKHNSVSIKTLSYNPAVINIKTNVSPACTVTVELLDGSLMIYSVKGDNVDIEVPNATLWSSETPKLYTCKILLHKDDILIDEQLIPFGIRLLEWIPREGFFVNGEMVKLKGCAIHHDNGILGAVDLYDATYRKLKLLKDFGYNAIRSAHNPCSTNVLKACDELGLYVMDEAFDMWYIRKNRYDYGYYFEEWYENDIKAMVDKDRNHPSVIMYSSGNEVPETAQEKGVEYTKKLTDLFHKLDPTRPVTCGVSIFMNMLVQQGYNIYTDWDAVDEAEANGVDDSSKFQGLANEHHKKQEKSSSEKMNEMANMMIEHSEKAPAAPEADLASTPAFNNMDIAGYNYATIRYSIDKDLHPDRLIVGTETTLRGFKRNWDRTIHNSNVVGDFVWAGYQYLGEAGFGAFGYMIDGIYNKESYPWLTNQTYALDILGDMSEHGALVKSVWGTLEKPFIAVKNPKVGEIEPIVNNWRLFDGSECWTWPGYENSVTDVWVVSPSPYVQLIVNGTMVDTVKTKDNLAFFKGVMYVPGEIVAISLDENMNSQTTSTIRTVNSADKIKTILEKDVLRPNNEDVAFIEVLITDKQGNRYNSDEHVCAINIEGPATLAGMGSSYGLTKESFTANSFTTYRGKLLVAIRSKFKEGNIKVTVTSEGLESSTVEIAVKK